MAIVIDEAFLPATLTSPPMTDEEFAVVRRAYAYDKRDLNARVAREAETVHWVRERVEYDAAYGRDRAVAGARLGSRWLGLPFALAIIPFEISRPTTSATFP